MSFGITSWVGQIVLAIAVIAITLGIIVPWLSRRDARVKQRLDLLGESLKNPQLEAQVSRQILLVLAKEHQSSRLHFLKSPVFWQRLVFGGGWLMFVFCGGMAALSWGGLVDHGIAREALVYALLGLAVASLPFAMREISSRQAAKQ